VGDKICAVSSPNLDRAVTFSAHDYLRQRGASGESADFSHPTKRVAMNSNDNESAFGVDDPGQPDNASSRKESLPDDREENITRRESAVIGDEASVLIREKLVSAREKVADLRENTADSRDGHSELREETASLRELTVTSREREVHAAEALQSASDDQVAMLQQANAHLVVAAIDAHKLAEQVEAAKAQLDHLAHHDVLTGLPNRLLLQDRLSQAIESARRQGKQLAVMFLDLDRFKHINDSLGHAVGDQLLRSVAQCLVSNVRHSDTVSRQGGDEFILLLPHIEHAEDAALSAQKLLAALARAHHIGGQDLHIGVSIGISIYPGDGQDVGALIRSADTAMYYAKENGRNNYRFFEQEMNARAVQRQSIEASLRRALGQQEFVLLYQPKVNLQSGAIVGVEALLRWQHPEQGLLSPALFLPVAEECGLILPIGRWVLRQACLQARVWRQAGLPPITIAVNASAHEFRAKDFLEYIRATLADTCMEPRHLEIELTESVLMRDAESTNSVLQALADLGVRLALDDFGTGYSSLSYLRRFPIDTLKIDQSFVKHMIGNTDDATIVSAVVGMGKNLKKCVIAEGVETPEQYAALRDLHCDEGQGYYFGPPMAAEAFASLLQTGLSLKINSPIPKPAKLKPIK
jgi:diguanylate cyclase (GGDEF)-like protein